MSKKPSVYQNKFSWPKVGNDGLLEFLDRSLSSGKLAQTYIFSGPEDLGKSTVALAFARNLILADNGEIRDFSTVNSDLHILSREVGKKNISIEAVRDFIKILSLSSFLNSYKIGIIKEAETLSPEAASALLKTLEEPREKVIIILLTSALDSLLPTIVSRSQVLYFYPVDFETVYDYLSEELNLKRSEAKEIAALSAGRPLLAARFVENPAIYENKLETARLFLSFFKSNIPTRLKNLNSYLSSISPLTADKAANILDDWSLIARDLNLKILNCDELIIHVALLKEISTLTANNNEESLIYYSKVLELLLTLKPYLTANVSPQTILEQVIYNI
jgi:DNA polymerase-3 subunit delta'